MTHRILLYHLDISHLSDECVSKHFSQPTENTFSTVFLLAVSLEEETFVTLMSPVHRFFSLMVSTFYRNPSSPESSGYSPRCSRSRSSDYLSVFVRVLRCQSPACFSPHSCPANLAPLTGKIIFLCPVGLMSPGTHQFPSVSRCSDSSS